MFDMAPIWITNHGRLLAILVASFILVPTQPSLGAASGKVVDFGDKLPDYIKENPQKGWLIKFYTPWCHNCQQIELTYIEVAEKIYHAHDHLIVGQVNCDRYDAICRQFNVHGVPTILYIRNNHQSAYKGLREVNSIVSFAERMNGPDVNVIHSCSQVISEAASRETIILHSTSFNSSSKLTTDIYHRAFNSIAAQLKRDFWFYILFNKACDSAGSGDGIYIVKRNLRRWIKFEPTETKDLEYRLEDFIRKESFPVFSPLSDQMMNTTKLLAVAVLEQYGPAKKLDLLSRKFYKVFEQVAFEEAQKNDHIVFAWSTDLHAIRKIALSHVMTPNVIMLKADMSHHLLIKADHNLVGRASEQKENLHETLSKEAVSQLIQRARDKELEFSGGDTYYHRLIRYIYSYIIMVRDRYEANPVLTSLMLISMATTTLVLVYKTKNYLRDDEEVLEEEPLLDHKKND